MHAGAIILTFLLASHAAAAETLSGGRHLRRRLAYRASGSAPGEGADLVLKVQDTRLGWFAEMLALFLKPQCESESGETNTE